MKPTLAIAPLNRSGRSFTAWPTMTPPADVPIRVRRCGVLMPIDTSASATAMASRQVFALVSAFPA